MLTIPSINCHYKDFECVETKVREAEKFFADLLAEALAKEGWVHLDIADGKFTYNKTWDDAAAWPALQTKLNLEVHLMVEDPLSFARLWLAAGAKRIIVHAETIDSEVADEIIALASLHKAEVMLSSVPEAKLEFLGQLLQKFSMHQVLTVTPGLEGQKFLPKCLEKVSVLRQMFPNAIIEVDGGVNQEVAQQAKDAGANIVVAATAIFGADDPKAAYEKLKEI